MKKRRSLLEWFIDVNFDYFPISFFIIGFLVIATACGVYYYSTLDDQHILMDEKIVFAEVVDGGEYGYTANLILIRTEFGHEYVLNFRNNDNGMRNIDLTVNSKLVLNLFNDGSDDVWLVEDMYKLPDENNSSGIIDVIKH